MTNKGLNLLFVSALDILTGTLGVFIILNFLNTRLYSVPPLPVNPPAAEKKTEQGKTQASNKPRAADKSRAWWRKPTQPQQTTQPSSPNRSQQPATNDQQPATSNPKPATSRTIHAGNQTPVNSKQPMSATIQADHSTNPHNPTVTITWADGYTYTGDETAIRGRFTTTFRDTLGLRLVQAGRYSAMWRWSSPWRAAGFYQALTHLIGGAPTIHELGITRPNELTRTVFQHIAEKALQPQL